MRPDPRHGGHTLSADETVPQQSDAKFADRQQRRQHISHAP